MAQDLTNHVPMLAPDGTAGLADPTAAQGLVDHGYTPGHVLRAPDGIRGVVKMGDVQKFISNGYMQEGDWQRAHSTPVDPTQIRMGSDGSADVPAGRNPNLFKKNPTIGEWFTQAPNVGHLRQNISESISKSEAPPTLEETNSPMLSGAKRFVEGFSGNAAKMLINPLGAVTAVAGPLGEAPGAVGIGARTGLAGLGIGFGVQGGKDFVQHGVTPNPALGEKGYYDPDYASRVLGDTAGVVGGVAGLVETPHIRYGRSGKPVVNTTKTPPPPPGGGTPTPPVDPGTGGGGPGGGGPPVVDPATAAAARKAQAVGAPRPAETPRTVYVDPKMADVMDAWNKQDALGGKRVVIDKQGNINLVHSDPDGKGFKPSINLDSIEGLDRTASDTPDPQKVAVELRQSDGFRATKVARNYVANRILRPTREATEQAAVQPTQTTLPESTATAPTPVSAPATSAPETPKAPDSGLGFKEAFASAKGAVGDSFASDALDRLKRTGSMMFADKPGTLENKITTAYKDGKISTVDDIKAIVQQHYAPKTSAPVESTGGVGPGVSNLPADLSKSSPNYGYKGNNFKLQFEDPRDLAAYTVAQKTQNKAHGRFMDYLRGEYPNLTDEQIRAKGASVRDAVKQLAKNGDPKDGPLKIAKVPEIETTKQLSPMAAMPKEVEAPERGMEDVNELNRTPALKAPAKEAPALPTPQAKTPFTPPDDLSAREAEIRPLIGQTMRLGQLREGELNHHAIDIGIRESQDPNGVIPEDVGKKLSALLKQDVGNRLTPIQMTELERIRGTKISDEPKIKVYDPATVRARLADPVRGEAFQAKLDRADEAVLMRLQDPNLSEPTKAKLMALLEPDAKGNRKFFSYDKEAVSPEPVDLPPDHPEYPFAPKAFGNEIAPSTIKNLTAALGRKPYTKFQDSANGRPHVSPEDLAALKELKGSKDDVAEDEFESAKGELGKLLGSKDAEESGGFNVLNPDKGVKRGSEAAEFERVLGQRANDSRQARTLGVLKGKIGELLKAGGPSPELRAQLDALSPSVKKLLPKELFDGTEQIGASSTPEGKTASITQPVESTPTGKTSGETPSAGKSASVKGTSTPQLEAKILEEFPDKQVVLDALKKAVNDRHPENKTAAFKYNKALQVYYEAMSNEDAYASLKALDAVNALPKGVTLGSGLGGAQDLFEKQAIKPLTPEERHTVSSQAADAFLTRWENMSQAELMKKKAGLWKDSLVKPIEQSAPFSDDPVVRQEQADTYNELKARHDALKQIVGGPSSLFDRLSDKMNEFRLNQQSKQEARQLMREVAGTRDRDNAILRQHWDNVNKFFENLPFADQSRFWENMTTGHTTDNEGLFDAVDPDKFAAYAKKNGAILDPNEIARQLRDTMDNARDRVTATSGKLENFFVNYMPGFWDNQAKARSFTEGWVSNRDLQGNTGFLKQKMYEYYSDAMKAGLQPATANPVRAAMMITEQLNRYTMAHDFKNQMLDRNMAAHFEFDETPPQGWEKLDDRLFNTGKGGYYAPSTVARTFNNFVSTGLRGKWKIPYTNFSMYDAIRSSTNLQNGLQLGLSAFHATETMLNSGFSTMAVGLRQAINEGKPIRGALNFAKGSTFVIPLVEDLWNGQKALVEFKDPGKQLKYQQVANDLEAAHANVSSGKWDLPQLEAFKKNFADARDSLLPNSTRGVAVAKAGLHLLGTAVETTMAPLMQTIIPRVKLGAFYKIAQQIHSEYEGATPETINLEMQKAWDSIDNRFGQVNYQNMFMNKITQDLASLLVRSPGWNIGTLREVGMAVPDLLKSVKDDGQGKGFKISNRTAYTASMVMGTMMVNAVYQYLKSGIPPEGIDYFFPRDGSKTVQGEANRMYPKTYVYDFVNMYHDPVHTVEHKMAPALSTMSDILNNADYYHRQIRDPGANFPQQAASTLAYVANQFVPFSFKNLQESRLRNQNASWESGAGILPAPRWVGRTNAENLAFQYFQNTKPTGPQDPIELEKKQNFVNLRNDLATGKQSPDDIQKYLDAGKISPNTVKYLFQTIKDPQLVTWVKQLRSPQEVWNVFNAASPEEKKLLFRTTLTRTIKGMSGPEQQQKIEQLQQYANKMDSIPDSDDEDEN